MRALFAALIVTCATPSARAQTASETWTVVIDGAFSQYVYTWRLKRDGTYEEDGRDRDTGEPIQLTLTGTWTSRGSHMRLEQDTFGYVFDGRRSGEQYYGQFLAGSDVLGAFCAWKGTQVPASCHDDRVG